MGRSRDAAALGGVLERHPLRIPVRSLDQTHPAAALYRHGHPTDGTVLGKRTKPGKTPRYYITYSFLHPDTGDLRNAETEVLVADYDRAKINQPVTVLYAPGHPQRSTLYEFGGYHVRDVAVV